jgi:hypothetical protein
MEKQMNEVWASLMVSICLYSTNHWIGGTVALVLAIVGALSA